MPKLNLTKEMYGEAKKRNISFTALLHEQAPGDDKLDAYEVQLREYGLKVSGKQISLVEEFYKTASSSALFPEFINRNVLLGMDLGRNQCQLADLVANTRQIDSVDYTGLSATAGSGESGAFRVGESGEFPSTTITFASKSVKLLKFGHKINITYEVLRRMAIDQLAVHLQLIGRKLRNSMVDWAIDVIINGDGNSNPAPIDAISGLTYDHLIDFDANWDDYEASLWVAAKAGVSAILKMAEFKDPQAGFNYQATGKMISPLGVTLRKNASVPASKLIGVDKSAALEFIQESGSQLTEVDKVIDKQLEESVISQVAGFSKIYTAACRVLNYT